MNELLLLLVSFFPFAYSAGVLVVADTHTHAVFLILYRCCWPLPFKMTNREQERKIKYIAKKQLYIYSHNFQREVEKKTKKNWARILMLTRYVTNIHNHLGVSVYVNDDGITMQTSTRVHLLSHSTD